MEVVVGILIYFHGITITHNMILSWGISSSFLAQSHFNELHHNYQNKFHLNSFFFLFFVVEFCVVLIPLFLSCKLY